MKLFPELQLELQIWRDDRPSTPPPSPPPPSPPPPSPPEVFDLLLNQFPMLWNKSLIACFYLLLLNQFPMLPDEEKLGLRCQKKNKNLMFLGFFYISHWAQNHFLMWSLFFIIKKLQDALLTLYTHIYMLHMSNVHQYIWWQVDVRWFFLRELDHLHILCIWPDIWIWRKIWQISLLWKISWRELKKKVYKLAKIFSVWPDAVPGGWSNRLGSWNWQQNSFWDFQSLTCLTTEQTSRLTWTK